MNVTLLNAQENKEMFSEENDVLGRTLSFVRDKKLFITTGLNENSILLDS